MDKKHKELLAACGEDKPIEELVALVKRHRARGDNYDLKEIVETFPRKHYEQLWSALHVHVSAIVEGSTFTKPEANDEQQPQQAKKSNAKAKPAAKRGRGRPKKNDEEDEMDVDDEVEEVDDEEEEEEEEKPKNRSKRAKKGSEDKTAETALEYLRAVALLASLFIASKDRIAPDSLFDSVALLHGILLDVLAIKGAGHALLLHNEIAQLCETWWKQDRTQKEALVPLTIFYLVLQTLEEGAKAATIKRLYDFRSALLLLDFQDDSSTQLKGLLLRCFIHPMFLRAADGKKFLVYLFGLHPPYIDAIHDTIKGQLPACPKSLLEAYGEVYFKAWKVAQGPYLLKLEYTCLQDLISCAVHVQNEAVVSGLRKVLRHIHEQKKQKGVDEMLLRLYEPIIWRSLKVANPMVRRNATVLLADAFPLQDPDSAQRETDELLQKQFNQFEALLTDDVPVVRCVAVQAVCRILGVFWELIPAATIRTLLTKLINDSARDKSSSAVRQAVFEGLRYLLDNHLSQPVLKTHLPQLAPLIHDTAERVRVAFIDLLCEIKTIRAIRFYDIVPIEHLLTRLELDSLTVQKKLTKLLLNSYFPLDRKGSVQAKRCIILVQGNRKAGLHFYASLRQCVAAGPLCKFIGVLYKLLCKCIERAASSGAGAKDNGKGKGKRARDEEEKSEEISAKDSDLMESILEVMYTLWDSILPDLKKEENKAAKKYLKDTFNDEALENLTTNFTTPKAQLAILRIASNLPKANLTRFATTSLAKLKQLNEGDENTNKFEPLLSCLFAWKYEADVIKLIRGWLVSGLAQEGGAAAAQAKKKKAKANKKKTQNKKKATRGRKARDDSEDEDGVSDDEDDAKECKPFVALRLLGSIMEREPMREKLFKRYDLAVGIMAAFESYLTLIEKRFDTNDDDDDENGDEELPDATLFRVMDCFTRFLIHAIGSSEPQWKEKGEEVLERLLTWTNGTLLPVLRNTPADDSEEALADAFAFIDQLAKHVAVVATELVAFGLCDNANIRRAVELTKGLLSVSRRSFVESLAIPITSRLLYQLYHEGSNEELASSLFMFVLEVIPAELLPNLRPFISELFALHNHRGSLSLFLHPLLEKLLLEFIEVPTAYPCNLARSVSHLPATPAFVISNVMRSSPAVASLAELLEQMLSQGSIDDGESYLQLLWRALEVISVMVDNEDAAGGKAGGGKSGGKQADLSPLQNCLISIVSKTRLGDNDDEDDIDVDENRELSAAVISKLADGLLKQSMGGGDLGLDDDNMESQP